MTAGGQRSKVDRGDVPPDIAASAEAAFRADYPERAFSGVRVRAAETERYVVAVYTPVPGLSPIPYLIYAVDRDTLIARKLSGDESEPYAIKGYR